MPASPRFCFLFAVVLLAADLLTSVSSACLNADEPLVRFDVPALVAVHEIIYAEGHEPVGDQKTIEVVIPVSSEIASSERGNVDEFRYDIYWNRSVYPMVDYAPKTQMVSDIEGLVEIETTERKNAGIGINVSSNYLEFASGSAKADLSKQSGVKRTYREVPQHEVLVASGTVRRGTGAYFRFHPSRRETVEGGRDLVVAFRVPTSWKGGVLKVECRAEGHHKVFGAWKEAFGVERAFVVPIYLDDDDAAREAAFEFVRTEQRLRKHWRKLQTRSHAKPSGLFTKPSGLFAKPSPSAGSHLNLPSQWVHYLIQSGNDDYLTQYRSRLPDDLESAAQKFAAARTGLLEFSR